MRQLVSNVKYINLDPGVSRILFDPNAELRSLTHERPVWHTWETSIEYSARGSIRWWQPMNQNPRHNPFPVTAGFESIYAHGVEVPERSRMLFVSGQIGITPRGEVLGSFRAQFEQAIDNLIAVLASADMQPSDLVKLVFFVTRATDLSELGQVRKAQLALGTAVTTLVVAGLARPDLLIEVEGVAARRAPGSTSGT